MISLFGPRSTHYEGFSRREFLRFGGLGALGLSLPSLLGARSASAATDRTPSFGRAKHCILLFLTGGPSQLDTFDPKPDAPAEIRGEFRPIQTATPGLVFGEHVPLLAARSADFAVVRSLTHADTVHTSAGYTLLTGVPHPAANSPGGAATIKPSASDHPHYGSLLARFRPAAGGMPSFVALPEVVKDAGVNEFPGQGAGLLGRRFDPFRIEHDDSPAGFKTPDLVLPADLAGSRLVDRRRLRRQLGELVEARSEIANETELESYYRQAFEILSSPAVSRAFELDAESPRAREAYGDHLFGRGCLLARRLVEAGVAMTTVYWHYDGPEDSPSWDTHNDNFRHLRERLLPPADRAIAALVDDMKVRGLLDETLVVCLGEFGRTPRISAKAGRGHWPFAQSALLAGAGVRTGPFGSTDHHAAYPVDRPMSPADLAATLLHLLGVDPKLEMRDALGRPHVVNRAHIVSDLLGRPA
jgi:hypothetical protein